MLGWTQRSPYMHACTIIKLTTTPSEIQHGILGKTQKNRVACITPLAHQETEVLRADKGTWSIADTHTYT